MIQEIFGMWFKKFNHYFFCIQTKRQYFFHIFVQEMLVLRKKKININGEDILFVFTNNILYIFTLVNDLIVDIQGKHRLLGCFQGNGHQILIITKYLPCWHKTSIRHSYNVQDVVRTRRCINVLC